jgi:hypothetical protein
LGRTRQLGVWILFSALALFIYKQALNERQLERDLDMLDGLVTAEFQSSTAKHFEGPQADQKQMQLEETAGIPTGIAPTFTGKLNCGRRSALPRLTIWPRRRLIIPCSLNPLTQKSKAWRVELDLREVVCRDEQLPRIKRREKLRNIRVGE